MTEEEDDLTESILKGILEKESDLLFYYSLELLYQDLHDGRAGQELIRLRKEAHRV